MNTLCCLLFDVNFLSYVPLFLMKLFIVTVLMICSCLWICAGQENYCLSSFLRSKKCCSLDLCWILHDSESKPLRWGSYSVLLTFIFPCASTSFKRHLPEWQCQLWWCEISISRTVHQATPCICLCWLLFSVNEGKHTLITH